MPQSTYSPTEFNLSGLKGISDRTLEMHFDLYRGYVKNTNLLTEQIMGMVQQKKMSAANPAYAELTRHLGFEYGGMVLHEYYFENLAPQGRGKPSGALKQALEQNFGSFETWKEAFVGVASIRGVGWAALYQDPATEQLSNHWIASHQDGVPTGFKPLLIMDAWEHAFLLDYKATERGKYIEAFFANIDWDVVSRRLTSEAALRAVA